MIVTVALTLLASTAPPGPPEVESDVAVPYVFLGPGVGAVGLQENPSIHTEYITNETPHFAYQWGIRGGVLRRYPRHLAMGFGGHVEHSFSNSTIIFHTLFPEELIYNTTTHLLRVQVEYLPGLLVANERVFVHAIVGFGYMGEYLNQEVNMPVYDAEPKRRYHGLAVSPGLGLFGRIWPRLSLGVHVGVDLGWTNDGGDFVANHAFDVATEIGWMF